MNMVDDFPSRTAWWELMPMEKPLFGKKVICKDITEAWESDDSKCGTKERDSEASRGELSKLWLNFASSLHCARTNNTPSPGLNWMKGLPEWEGQMIFPAKGGKCWRVLESEVLRFGSTLWKKKEGLEWGRGRG